MPTTTKSTKTQDVEDALDFLEEDANQLRVAGHGSLQREGALASLRGSVGKIGDSKLRPREAQPWPVTAEAGSYAGTEYAQPGAVNGLPNDMGFIEGDPHRDHKAVLAQVETERTRAELDGTSPKK
jgi:hypothetical protein